MKKLLLFTASLLLLGGTTSSAQDWKEALKKAATAAADKATDGKLTQYALAGTWNYTGPGVKFEGGDIASEVGGAALETAVVKQLEKAYAKAGIRPGAGTFTFGKDDDAFTATLGSHTLSGTYEYDAPTHVVTLQGQAQPGFGSRPRLHQRAGTGAGLPGHQTRRGRHGARQQSLLFFDGHDAAVEIQERLRRLRLFEIIRASRREKPKKI